MSIHDLAFALVALALTGAQFAGLVLALELVDEGVAWCRARWGTR